MLHLSGPLPAVVTPLDLEFRTNWVQAVPSKDFTALFVTNGQWVRLAPILCPAWIL